MQHQNNKKTDSKTNYEDCFVYGESRFTGKVLKNSPKNRIYVPLFESILNLRKLIFTTEPTFIVNRTIHIIGL